MERWHYTNARGRPVGWVENNTYYSRRDYERNQIFKKPKYECAMAIDKRILRDLVAKGVIKIRFMVLNFDKESFWAEITLKEFLRNSFEINFKRLDKKDNAKPYTEQRACAMKFWRRVYPSQNTLDMFMEQARKEGLV